MFSQGFSQRWPFECLPPSPKLLWREELDKLRVAPPTGGATSFNTVLPVPILNDWLEGGVRVYTM